MRQALIAANWKTHGSLSFVDSFCAQLASELSDVVGPDVSGSANDVVICPPAVYLQVLGAALAADLGSVRQIGVGAQDIGISATGAHTGELAAEMVADTGGQWAIVGHSERRLDQGETDDLVATKAAAALRGGLRPIVCVGETLQERQAGQEIAVVQRQLEAVLDRVDVSALATGAIGYEPVWAIGTGETATPDQAQAMHSFIRAALAEHDAAAAEQVKIIYGGSVKPENARELFSEIDIDGALVGGASLDPASFAQIVAAADELAGRKLKIESE